MHVLIRGFEVKIDWATQPVVWGPSDLQNRITTARFVWESLQQTTAGNLPKVGDPVRITDDSGNYTLFDGHIAQIHRGGDPVGRRCEIACQDANAFFDKIRLPNDFVYAAGLNDAQIVTDLLGGTQWPIVNGVRLNPGLIINFVTNDRSGGASAGLPTIAAKAISLPAVTIKAGLSLTDALNQVSTLVGGVAWFLEAFTTALNNNRVFHWNDLGALAPLVLTTSPAAWPNATSYFYNYSEFIDRTTHFTRVRVDNAGALSAVATDWPAFGDVELQQNREFAATNFVLFPGQDRILEGPRVSDSTLATQAAVTQRAYQELAKGRIRRTVSLTYDRATTAQGPPLQVGMLVDLVHTTWDNADVPGRSNSGGLWGGDDNGLMPPVPHISREVGTHSNIRGELVPGSRGRYLIQAVTPSIKAKGSPTLYSYDLILGDYEDTLATTLAHVV